MKISTSIPDPIIVNTGEQANVQPLIDDFFYQTYTFICERDDLPSGTGMHPYFEIKLGELAYSGVVTDDSVSCLLYKEAVIAIVIATRTELNRVRYDFFRTF